MCDFILLNKDLFNKLDISINTIQNPKDNLLEVLHNAQNIFGYLPSEVTSYISSKIDVNIEEINDLINFYSYFTTELKGKYKINVCLGALCVKRGSEKILLEFENQLGIKRGQTTSDLKFSLDASRCAGSCGRGPIVVINEKSYSYVTEKDVTKILKDITE